MKFRHSRAMNLKRGYSFCYVCGSKYAWNFQTCPRCAGLIPAPVTSIPAEQTASDAPAPSLTPLRILADKISAAGYLGNMRAIAAGRLIGKVTPALAEAIVNEADGHHAHSAEMQYHAARLLKAAFGVDVAVPA